MFYKMVAKNPDERYQSMSEPIVDLDSYRDKNQLRVEKGWQHGLLDRVPKKSNQGGSDSTEIFSTVLQEKTDRESHSDNLDPSVERTASKTNTRIRLYRGCLILVGFAVLWWSFSNREVFLGLLGPSIQTPQEVAEKTSTTTASQETGVIEDASRAAALRVLELGGSIEIIVQGQPQIIQNLANLPDRDFQIREIILHENEVVRDEDLKFFSALQYLEFLDLYDTDVTDIGLENLKHLPALLKMDLFQTLVSDPGLEQVGRFTTLQSLSLQNTAVSNVGLKHLARLSNLNSLNLGNIELDDSGLVHLKSLTGLQWLQLSFTNVTDTGMRELQGLESLRELYVNRHFPDGLSLEPFQARITVHVNSTPLQGQTSDDFPDIS